MKTIPGFQVPIDVMDGLCLYYGSRIDSVVGVDGVALMQAIADNESSYGTRCTPKHEAAYDWGGKYAQSSILRPFGSWAACSYGGWQVMFAAIREMGFDVNPLEAATDPTISASAAERLINRRFLPKMPKNLTHEGAVRHILDAYNSGSGNDRIVPEQYIAKGLAAYAARHHARQNRGTLPRGETTTKG